MQKILAKFLIVAFVCAVLAIFWHSYSMSMPMEGSAGMSASCLTVCYGTDAGFTPADVLGAKTPAVALFAAALLLVIHAISRFLREAGFSLRDRHRYLMKTMVMRR